MSSLRAASHVVGAHLSGELQRHVWPVGTIGPGGVVSCRRLVDRFSHAGAALDALARDRASVWPHVDRGALVAGLRARLLDPAVVDQHDLPFCGPASIAFEMARRLPARYVEAITAAYKDGQFKTANGRVIRAEQEVLDGPMPSPAGGKAVDPADWVLTATLRDDENAILDIHGDEAKDGASGGTTCGEMEGWTRDVLGLKAELFTCVTVDEAAAMRLAADAVRKGGVAFLNVDANLIVAGTDSDVEEKVWFERVNHVGPLKGVRQAKCHSKDDTWVDHWVVLLGGLEVAASAGDDSLDPVSMQIWSWGSEFTVTGTVASLGEYLWAVVVGRP